jgi:hypothetical protein
VGALGPDLAVKVTGTVCDVVGIDVAVSVVSEPAGAER